MVWGVGGGGEVKKADARVGILRMWLHIYFFNVIL